MRRGCDSVLPLLWRRTAIVTTAKGRYVVAIFARRVKDMRWTVDNDALVTGAWVSRAVYDHFTR